MATPAEIGHLEQLADEAWPPAVIERHDGWLLRWAEGPWNRTNSVAPAASGTAPLAAKIDHAERWYRERNRIPVFKLTEAARPPGLEAALERRGYRMSFAVSVQSRPNLPGPIAADVALTAWATGSWLEAKQRLAGVGSGRARHLPALLARITAPIAFVSIPVEDRTAAVGLGVVTRGHVGVFDLAVDPEFRRRGLATRVIETLMAWGAEHGAATAYLQVEVDNAPALALYERLGFAEVYRYWYRRAEDESVSGPTG